MDLGYKNVVEFILRRNDWAAEREIEAPFQNKNVEDLDLSGSTLRNIDFELANLSGSNFTKTRLDGCDFTDAEVYSCNFTQAQLPNVIFDGAQIADTTFFRARLTNVRFAQARTGISLGDPKRRNPIKLNFESAHLIKCSMPQLALNNANFKNCIIEYSHLGLGGVFIGANFTGSNIRDSIMSNSDFSHAIFSESFIMDTNFSRSVFNGTVFGRKGRKRTASISRSNLDFIQFDDDTVFPDVISSCSMKGVDLDRPNFKNVELLNVRT